jgi:hypothetical protein
MFINVWTRHTQHSSHCPARGCQLALCYVVESRQTSSFPFPERSRSDIPAAQPNPSKHAEDVLHAPRLFVCNANLANPTLNNFNIAFE